MRRLALALLPLFAVMACARPASVEVKDAWTRQTVAGVADAAVFMTLRSPVADRLVAASTPVATKTDLMTMQGSAGVMSMAYVEAVDLPANRPVSLNAGGLHVWLAGLKAPLKAGDRFPLTLRFEKAAPRQVTVTVIKAAAPAPAAGMGM